MVGGRERRGVERLTAAAVLLLRPRDLRPLLRAAARRALRLRDWVADRLFCLWHLADLAPAAADVVLDLLRWYLDLVVAVEHSWDLFFVAFKLVHPVESSGSAP